ncbi:MAG: J domain-containing protein [Bacteroidales bacterium]
MRPYYYRILEVDPDATQEEIRRAYRRLAKRYHPDVNREPGARDQFLLVQKAWGILGDPVARRSYDHYALRYTHTSGDPYARRTTGTGQGTPTGTTRAYTGYGGRVYYRTVDQTTLEREEKTRRRDWIIAGAIILFIFLIPVSGRMWQRLKLRWYGTETVAEVVSLDASLTFFFYGEGQTQMSEAYPGLFSVGHDLVIPGGMPVAPGDRFRVKYLPSHPAINKIALDQPSDETLDKYCMLIYTRWASSTLLDTLAAGSMKAVFTYTLCDSLYQQFGTYGLANLYFAATPTSINPHNNLETYQRMLQKPVFQRIVKNVREKSRAD